MTLPVPIVAMPSLELAHHRVHEGNHFMVHKIYTGVATTRYFLVIPPPAPINPNNTVEMHLIFDIDTEPGGTLQLFEGPTITNNGASLNIINNNRRSSTSSLANVYETPTVTNDGTLIFEEAGGTIANGAELGEMDRDDEELILHPAKKYLFKFVPYAAATITFELNWYDNRSSTSFIWFKIQQYSRFNSTNDISRFNSTNDISRFNSTNDIDTKNN